MGLYFSVKQYKDQEQHLGRFYPYTPVSKQLSLSQLLHPGPTTSSSLSAVLLSSTFGILTTFDICDLPHSLSLELLIKNWVWSDCDFQKLESIIVLHCPIVAEFDWSDNEPIDE
ncbi:hypothetical protein ACTXT7_013062 [Hymenolepis weldensis]